jgi:acetolactate synthase-1/2/3 large subunit
MTKMTGGQALVQSLYREGVRTMFGLPGVQLYYAMDAFHAEPRIRFITTRHEQAAAYMAYGYSAAGDDIGAALVVPGPGLLNAAAAVGTAYSASVPMLLISGQIERDFIGKGEGRLHEIVDQLDAIKTVTKWVHRILDPAKVPAAVHEAFVQMKSGRPLPVEIEIPPETLEEEAEVEFHAPALRSQIPPSDDSVAAAASALAEAKEPLIWAGEGALSSGCAPSLMRLAEHLQAPIVCAGEAKGTVSDRHYLAMGVPNWRRDSLDDLLDRADVILAVGASLARSALRPEQSVVLVDVDATQSDDRVAVEVIGDVLPGVEALEIAVLGSTPSRSSRRDEFEAVRSARYDPNVQIEPQGSFVRAIRSAMPDDGILIEGVTQLGYYSRPFYRVNEPGTYISSSYFGNLGYAYPTALGAKVARPDRAVVAVSGDGGFLFNSQELATAVKYGINAVVIVFNDGAFGNVYRDQTLEFEGRTIGSELRDPDFMKLAEAYGARGVRARGPEALESALRESLAIAAPTLIEVPVGMMPIPF